VTTGFKSIPCHGTVGSFLDKLRARHLRDLEFREVRRALQALSTSYVERRSRVAAGRALASAGKRAAYALYYGPIHLLTVDAIVRTLAAQTPPPRRIIDLGCGTGAAGAAWALACDVKPAVNGIDVHPWAVAEASWTLRTLGIAGRSRRGSLTRPPPLQPGDAVVAAWAINELESDARDSLQTWLLGAARDHPVLIVEPIARRAVPWWPDWQAAFEAIGGRADEWKFAVERPALVAELDQATGLDHRILKARSLWVST